ncbi:MAG: hypothetical protein ABI472_09895 [Ginsengibacter sp.]
MKKTLFALQMVSLLVMFPIYMIVEMNHDLGRIKENSIQPLVKEHVEKTGTRLSEIYRSENANDIFEVIRKTPLLNTY